MRKITIHILGDSTAAPKSKTARPESGWGEHLGEFFTKDVTIHNCAKNGLSTKSCLQTGIFKEATAHFCSGDYLLIQFGHNDQKVETENGTATFGEFLDNVMQFVLAAVSAHVTPILFTSVTRRDFQGEVLNAKTLGDYPAAIRLLANQKKVALVDMYAVTQKLYRTLGPKKTKALHLQLEPNVSSHYPNGIADNTHFNQEGATTIAALVFQELLKVEPALTPYQNSTPPQILFSELISTLI